MAAIAATVLGSGITGRVTGMVEDAITSVGTPGNGSGPQAGGEHGDEQQHDTPGGDQQPATPQADPDNDNDDEGEGGGGGGPLGSMPTLDTDLGPGSGSGESFAPLGVDNLLAGPPSAGLTPTYSTGDLRDDIADLADDAAESQARATREGLEMAEETIRGPIDLAQDLREDAPGTLRRGAENAIAGATELHNEYAATVRDSAELIRQGFDDGEYLSGLWDGASHLATWNLSQSAQLAISEEGYEHFANGEFEQGLVRSTANAASWLIGGPALKGLTKLPNGTGRNPDPDPDPEPDSHHLADGETDSQGQNRDEDDTDEPNGNCRTNSFTPGTPVLMADGSTTPIQDIQTGDEILAFDPATGEEGPREVTDTITGDGQKTLVDITVTDTDGTTSTLTATDEHPFWAPKAGQWVDATDLTPGTWLRTSTGTWTQITAVDTNTVDDQQVHNLTIDDLHTYYVVAGEVDVLVHNQGGCRRGKVSFRGNDLAQEAYDYRAANNLNPQRNISTFEYVDRDGNPQTITRANEPGGRHAESVIMNELKEEKIPNENITGVYSERVPCSSGKSKSCAARLGNYENAEISWSLDGNGRENFGAIARDMESRGDSE
ncbi:hypothetical protein F4561_004438 [Lipingzhangella halophila]|uniref:Hint domain-containing protein n=1 Tax=Lipingzhangella halophila TaxID=1783352 RepID=A0A7W7RKD9_9ACTN|nr:polymorphic toxin-type HINT domain-containing protein [Lipingzhangella halophila]MBB4933618.1 hypothetical protein [Lipingzhangella halophila]